MTRVVVELSGGVDSSITAYLLARQGFTLEAVFFRAWDSPQVESDQKMAQEVAKQLSLPFQVVDLRREYRQRVIDYFFQEYGQGRVPSPDVVCNREIKFGLFLDWAKKHGFEKVASGHYARIGKENGRLAIFQPRDKTKDQTYFLYQLKEEILPFILWPLAEMTKKEVKELARKLSFPNWDRPESMGICFIGPVHLEDFLHSRLPFKPGPVVLPTGEVVGKHKGAYFYALGQRHNFTIERPANLPRRYLYPDGGLKPLYVIDKDLKANRLVVGLRDDCWIKTIFFSQLTTIWPDEDISNRSLLVRLRNLGDLIPGKVVKTGEVILNQPAFITSPGQPVVFYTPSGRLVGGAIVDKVK